MAEQAGVGRRGTSRAGKSSAVTGGPVRSKQSQQKSDKSNNIQQPGPDSDRVTASGPSVRKPIATKSTAPESKKTPAAPVRAALAEKAAAKKTASEKTAAQKTPAEKTVAKKTVAKKTVAEKTAAGSAAKTAAARKTAGPGTKRPGTKRPGMAPTTSALAPTAESGSRTSRSSKAPEPELNKSPASGSGRVAEPPDSDRAPTTAASTAAKGATMAKPVNTEATASGTTTATRVPAASKSGRTATKAAPRAERSAAETEKIRVALSERLTELRDEYDVTMSEITELQRDRLIDSAGDDQADTGTKTFEREQEMTLAANLLERVTQVERALERLAEGNYGWCEKCGDPIPVERLAAFPSATLCVTCKQLEERR